MEDNLKNASLAEFRDYILHTVAPAVMKHDPVNCKLTLSAAEQPSITILPLKRNGFAMFSLVGIDRAAVLGELERHRNPDRAVYGYAVHESPYLLSGKSWPCGTESPGLVLLTMFRKKPGLPENEFMRIWFGEHSPLSIVVHPLINYIRNVVTGVLTDNAPAFDGIVEEHFGCDRDLLNPVKMFGGIRRFLPSMLRIWRHVPTFLDMSNIRNYICREYSLKGGLAACDEEMRDDLFVRESGPVHA
ncbi:MAG TPA: hypothetical protein PLM53_19815 [Spirochaetota bacterium]|nr:hypothetical protein [Spirochaetota bacterium]HPC43272.1 hypothetical protein [Spirochaetota bacterium]HPL17977.1 hypothetical protein [Spirochaetota bacterium]HQF10443.1 hypothetical protein [Spirochaetota bacterium]HQH99342.1 hypothetical protein [Spirochaetota bacterium]